MDKDRELRRLEALILKMRNKVIELNNYNRIMKVLNSVSDDKSFEKILKILSEGFKIDGCSLMILGNKGLETIAFYGSHQTVQPLAGKGALFFVTAVLTDGKAQILSKETGVLLSIPIMKGIGTPLGVLNLYRDSGLSSAESRLALNLIQGQGTGFSETEQRLFIDIATQIGMTLEKVLPY
jgi:hypothetical protein